MKKKKTSKGVPYANNVSPFVDFDSRGYPKPPPELLKALKERDAGIPKRDPITAYNDLMIALGDAIHAYRSALKEIKRDMANFKSKLCSGKVSSPHDVDYQASLTIAGLEGINVRCDKIRNIVVEKNRIFARSDTTGVISLSEKRRQLRFQAGAEDLLSESRGLLDESTAYLEGIKDAITYIQLPTT